MADSDPVIDTSTDMNGQFVLKDILLGRQSIEVRYIGYANQVIPNLYLSSGKETQVQINLKENAMDMEEVVVRYTKRKDIIIRGNSPIGVLWRLEGVEIPNPNHFGAMGTTGGPVSMVNNNLLMDSDFFS